MSTLDFSIADISDNVVEIMSSNGDVYCGGSDLDKILGQYIVDEFKLNENIDLSKDFLAMSRIMEAAEKAKIELSNISSTDINLPYITAAVDGVPKHLIMSISKSKFEQLIDGEVNKVINLGREAIRKANISTKDLDGILLVGGSTRIPKIQEELQKAFNKPLIKNVNVDEVVALGAAVQGSILSGENTDVLLLDVTPLKLGIDTVNGVMATIIDENTTIPCSKSQMFSTAADNQTAVTVVVSQGNRYLTKDNKQIGIFNLEGILPAPAGVPQIEVTFDIDSNGILSVSAKDKGTGSEQKITIKSKDGLSDEDIERMKQDAKEYAEQDKQRKEVDEKLNSAENYSNRVEKSIPQVESKMTAEDKENLLNKVSELRNAVKERNLEDVDKLKKELETLWGPYVVQFYEDAAKNKENTASNNTNPFNPMDNIFGGNPIG